MKCSPGMKWSFSVSSWIWLLSSGHRMNKDQIKKLKWQFNVSQKSLFSETNLPCVPLFYYHGIQGEKWKAASGRLCFWRFGARAPFLDGSTVLTNICTDMELYSNQQTVNAAFQSSESDHSENDTLLPSKSCLHTVVLFSAHLARSAWPQHWRKLKLALKWYLENVMRWDFCG